MPSTEPGRAPVLADVASLAGVSVPTVSRVLNGNAPVSAERRQRVEQAVRQLGYRPNAAAQSLVRGTRSVVAVIAGDTARYGYAMTIQGVEEEARAAGYAVAIGVVDSDDDAVVRRTVDLVMRQPLTGVVVLEFDPAGRAALQALPGHLPVVAASPVSVRDGVTRVVLDDSKPAQQATEHLLGLGHRTVHHVAIPTSGRPSGRVLGWRRALEAAGAPVPELSQGDWTPRSGYEAGQALARDPEVTAVLCGNDELAMGVIRAMTEAGRAVPQDVSVIGFDGLPVAEFTVPPLTTVRQDFAALGRAALTTLIDLAEGRTPRRQSRVRPELVLRASTAPAPS